MSLVLLMWLIQQVYGKLLIVLKKRGIGFSISEIDRSDLVLGVFEKGDVGPLDYFKDLCSKNKKILFQFKTK